MPYRKKLQLLLVLIVGVSCGLLVLLSHRKADQLAFGLVREKTISVAVATAAKFDGDNLRQLVSPKNRDAGNDELIQQKLTQARDTNDSVALPIRRLALVQAPKNEAFQTVVEVHAAAGENPPAIDPEILEKPDRKTPAAADNFRTDDGGAYISATAPIVNSEGRTVALALAEISGEKIQRILAKLLIAELVALLAAIGLAAALGAWLSRKVTRPLTELRDFVRRLGQGELAARLEIDSNDEFGELARAANLMAERLEERESLKGALVHYVRSQAADTSLSDPGSGVRVKRKVTVLVAELRGFGQLSSSLGSERVFALLNEYFSTMIDIVLRHRGSLEKSTDKSVIAVFGSASAERHQERKAVETALAMQHALARLLHEWEVKTDDPIVLDIGIHTASALAAEEGEKQLEFESVHRIVDKATEVKNACREQDCGLVVSDTTAKKLQSTFPLTAVGTGVGETPLHRVEMPQPVFR